MATDPAETVQALRAQISDLNPEAVFCDGYDEALIGAAYRGSTLPVAAYDYEKLIGIIVDTDECSVIDAIEYFEYNILGNASGDNAPLYVRLLPSKLSSLIT